MNLIELISKIVDSLAWPAVVVLLAFRFKHSLIPILESLSSILNNLNKVKNGGFEMEFSRKTLEIDRASPKAFGSDQKDFEPKINKKDSSPKAIIIEYWIDILRSAKKLHEDQFSDFYLNSDDHMAINDFLAKKRVLNAEGMKIFNELRKIRNRAVHEPDSTITIDQAILFAKQSNRLINYFDKYKKP
ncbi:hypothetical protein [Candidatus Electronema sp. JM]|uniref:hypothetical protein n=1 Tax=Candidatus Electronema sp. JM TaxID=3401571 RepID=UPI003AA95DE7